MYVYVRALSFFAKDFIASAYFILYVLLSGVIDDDNRFPV